MNLNEIAYKMEALADRIAKPVVTSDYIERQSQSRELDRLARELRLEIARLKK